MNDDSRQVTFSGAKINSAAADQAPSKILRRILADAFTYLAHDKEHDKSGHEKGGSHDRETHDRGHDREHHHERDTFDKTFD